MKYLVSLSLLLLMRVGFTQTLDLDSATVAEQNQFLIERFNEELVLNQSQTELLMTLITARSNSLVTILSDDISNRQKRIQVEELNNINITQLSEILNADQYDLYMSMRRSKEEQIGEERSLEGLIGDF